jgi:hypothetical protein
MHNDEDRMTITQPINYRMRPGIFRLQAIFCTALALFCLGMIGLLLWRQDKSILQYLLWLAGFGIWVYAIWYAVSAQLTIDQTKIRFTAGRTKLTIMWNQVTELGFEASGPVLYMQDSNHAEGSKPSPSKRNKRIKIPLYLFMDKWKTKEDWKHDLVGNEILNHAGWLIKDDEKGD